MNLENTKTAEPQVSGEVSRLKNLADKVCSSALELEERLGPICTHAELKDGVAEVQERKVPLAEELKDTGDTLETALGTLASILIRLEL